MDRYRLESKVRDCSEHRRKCRVAVLYRGVPIFAERLLQCGHRWVGWVLLHYERGERWSRVNEGIRMAFPEGRSDFSYNDVAGFRRCVGFRTDRLRDAPETAFGARKFPGSTYRSCDWVVAVLRDFVDRLFDERFPMSR